MFCRALELLFPRLQIGHKSYPQTSAMGYCGLNTLVRFAGCIIWVFLDGITDAKWSGLHIHCTTWERTEVFENSEPHLTRVFSPSFYLYFQKDNLVLMGQRWHGWEWYVSTFKSCHLKIIYVAITRSCLGCSHAFLHDYFPCSFPFVIAFKTIMSNHCFEIF